MPSHYDPTSTHMRKRSFTLAEKAANKEAGRIRRLATWAKLNAEAAARAARTDNLSTTPSVQATLDVIDILAAHKAAIKARSLAAFKDKIPS